MSREDELERELRSKNDRLWDLILNQISDNKKAIAELEKNVNSINNEAKILAIKVSAIIGLGVIVLKHFMDKIFH